MCLGESNITMVDLMRCSRLGITNVIQQLKVCATTLVTCYYADDTTL